MIRDYIRTKVNPEYMFTSQNGSQNSMDTAYLVRKQDDNPKIGCNSDMES